MAEKCDTCSRFRYDIRPADLLGVAFVVLRLVGEIDWSWWWVTAPIWGAFAVRSVIIAIDTTKARKEKQNG